MKINCEVASAAAMPSGVSAGSNSEMSTCAHWEKFVEGAKHVVFGSILNVLLLALPLANVAVYFNLGHVSIASKLFDFLNYMRLNFTGTVTCLCDSLLEMMRKWEDYIAHAIHKL